MKHTDKDIRALINKRRAELKRYDNATPAEQRRLTENGLNPYEPPETRAAKQKKIRDEIRRIFSKLPKEERDKLAAMGVYDDGSNRNKDARVIHRTGGGFSIKK